MMPNDYDPPTILLNVCEPEIHGRPTASWVVDQKTFEPFPISDPFGIRRAIFPILEMQSNDNLLGLGTGFVVDPWERILTAQHVVEKAAGNNRRGIVALFSYGLALGRIRIPNNAFGRITFTRALSLLDTDPFAELTGREKDVYFDLALGTLNSQHDKTLLSNLPIRADISGRIKVGDHVVALGFPYVVLNSREADSASMVIHNDQLYAARGVVTRLHSLGRGSSRPTPVFEVECNWPSGMSGGPVFNKSGEVVGIVSSSIDKEEGARAGLGWATWLEVFPAIDQLIPSIDPLNPKFRRCWGGFNGDDLMHTEDPSKSLTSIQDEFPLLRWRRTNWRVGTDEYFYDENSGW